MIGAHHPGRSAAGQRIAAAGEAFAEARRRRSEAEAAFRAALERAGGLLAESNATIVESVRAAVDVADVAPPRPHYGRASAILADAQRLFGVPHIDLLSHRRVVRIVMARRYAMCRLRDETLLSFPRIGKLIGGRDHSTVVNACSEPARAALAAYMAKHGIVDGRDRT